MLEFILVVMALLIIGFVAGLQVRKQWIAADKYVILISSLAGSAVTLIGVMVLEAMY